MSVLTAATMGLVVDSAAVRVRAGDTRPACIKTRATALHLAAPFARCRSTRIAHTAASTFCLRWQGPTGVCCAVWSRLGEAATQSCHQLASTSSQLHEADGPHSVGCSSSCCCRSTRMTHTRRSRFGGRTDRLACPACIKTRATALHLAAPFARCRSTRIAHTAASAFCLRWQDRLACAVVAARRGSNPVVSPARNQLATARSRWAALGRM